MNTITVTLISISTKGDCPRRRGLRPTHNVIDAAPHQAGGSLTCRRATNAPRGRRTVIQEWFTLEPMHKAATPCSLTHLGANLALTLAKLVPRTKYLISKLLDGLEVFLDVCVMSWNSSKFQMAGVRHIYSPPTWTSRLEPLGTFLRRHRNFRC
jgi:hypothetical protein